MQQRAPQFLVLEDRSYRSLRGALAALWETDPPAQSIGLYHSRVWPKDHHPVPGLFTSVFIHFSFVLLLVRLPFSLFFHRASTQPKAEEHHVHEIVYVLHPLNLSDHFLAVRPKGLGGKPGQGSLPNRPPARGGTAFHPALTIISNPPLPDNTRQTIVQPSSPPKLKIPRDLRLPNVLIGSTLAEPPKPESAATPPRPEIQVPVVPRIQSSPSTPAAPTLALTPPTNPLPNPLLPVSPPPAAPPEPSKTTEAPAIADLGIHAGTSSGASRLLSLSIDPAPAAESVTLPPGNRLGAFSISPAGGTEGSPGGIAGGDARGGSGGNGGGGDASAGVGAGDAGGGGGGTATVSEGISISGGNGNESGALPSFFASTLVYPVKPPGPRRLAMVVTAGPTGGGGLQVYGVLKGGKIYTIYLPMPGRNWVLQYCVHNSSARSNSIRPSHGIEIRMDQAIVPPSAAEQFDFHRPPLSKSATNGKQMIILQGIIREDGSVGELKILQGLLEAVDQAALAAFSRWKFRPALRSDKPIAVEVLVGIPLILPATYQ